jgi:hypothetical protein
MSKAVPAWEPLFMANGRSEIFDRKDRTGIREFEPNREARRRVSRCRIVSAGAERFVFVGEQVEFALHFFLPGSGVFSFRGYQL